MGSFQTFWLVSRAESCGCAISSSKGTRNSRSCLMPCLMDPERGAYLEHGGLSLGCFNTLVRCTFGRTSCHLTLPRSGSFHQWLQHTVFNNQWIPLVPVSLSGGVKTGDAGWSTPFTSFPSLAELADWGWVPSDAWICLTFTKRSFGIFCPIFFLLVLTMSGIGFEAWPTWQNICILVDSPCVV